MLGPSVFPDSQVLKMLGPSVFPDSQVEKSSFETQNGLFWTDFKSETISKYILDIPGVFPAHFPYIKYYFSRKIGQNYPKSRKIDILYKIPHFYPLWGAYLDTLDPFI